MTLTDTAQAPQDTLAWRQVLSAHAWSKPREVTTKFGPRIVCDAAPLPALWDMWNNPEAKDWLRAEGYSLNKDRSDKWRIAHWAKLPDRVIEQRQAAVDQSRAADAVVEVPCPDGLAYLGYQRAGISFGMSRPSVLIGDEMGLGKTIQAIGIINAVADIRRVLVICPASLKLNWARELHKWLVTPRPIAIVNGHFPIDPDGIVIINYDLLHKYAGRIRDIDWDLLIADEAHYLKSAKARRTRMIFGYKPTRKEQDRGEIELAPISAKRKVLLTGTPIANRPSELFPLIHYLDPDRWPNFFAYGKRYCAGFSNGYGWDFSGASNVEELQRKLRETVMVRRLKADVLTDLPAKRRQVVELPAGDAGSTIRAEYEAFSTRENEIAALQAHVEIAKASDDPAAYAAAVHALREGVTAIFTELSRLRIETARAKVPAVVEFVRDALQESEKVVVFAHHREVVAALGREFGDDAVTLVGETAIPDRQAAVDRFQTDPTCKVFLGSIMAAGVGITLTAASHVIFAELDWVPGNLSQAEDRCHRIGQRGSVLVQHLVLEGSIDATMAERVIAKQEIIDRALDSTEAPVYEEFSPVKQSAASAAVKPDKLGALAAKMTDAQCAAATSAIRILASLCDGAEAEDGMGFNKIDTHIGHSLAGQPALSRKQAALAALIARKYRRQLPDELVQALAA